MCAVNRENCKHLEIHRWRPHRISHLTYRGSRLKDSLAKTSGSTARYDISDHHGSSTTEGPLVVGDVVPQ